METRTVAAAVVNLLAPFLAQGDKMVAHQPAAELLAILERRSLAGSPLREALDDLKATPQDPDAQAALRQQLKKTLADNPALLAELSPWARPGGLVPQATSELPMVASPAVLSGKGAVVAGTIQAPVATEGSIAANGDVVLSEGSVVQVGGIRAGRIDAENVVEGVQAQGLAPAEAAGLVELARAIRSGGITADFIQAGNVVSGLQFSAGQAPTTPDELRREVSALRQQVQTAVAAGEIAKPGDAEDVQEALDTAEKELAKPQPDGERVVRKLEVANTILTRCAEVVQSAGNVGQQVLKLAPIAAALWALAAKLWGG